MNNDMTNNLTDDLTNIKKIIIEKPQKNKLRQNEIKKINCEKEIKMRVETKTWGLNDNDLSHETQLNILINGDIMNGNNNNNNNKYIHNSNSNSINNNHDDNVHTNELLDGSLRDDLDMLRKDDDDNTNTNRNFDNIVITDYTHNAIRLIYASKYTSMPTYNPTQQPFPSSNPTLSPTAFSIYNIDSYKKQYILLYTFITILLFCCIISIIYLFVTYIWNKRYIHYIKHNNNNDNNDNSNLSSQSWDDISLHSPHTSDHNDNNNTEVNTPNNAMNNKFKSFFYNLFNINNNNKSNETNTDNNYNNNNNVELIHSNWHNYNHIVSTDVTYSPSLSTWKTPTKSPVKSPTKSDTIHINNSSDRVNQTLFTSPTHSSLLHSPDSTSPITDGSHKAMVSPLKGLSVTSWVKSMFSGSMQGTDDSRGLLDVSVADGVSSASPLGAQGEEKSLSMPEAKGMMYRVSPHGKSAFGNDMAGISHLGRVDASAHSCNSNSVHSVDLSTTSSKTNGRYVPTHSSSSRRAYHRQTSKSTSEVNDSVHWESGNWDDISENMVKF
jgi:hypothetical protein